MNKRIIFLTLIALGSASSTYCAGTLVLVWATKLSEDMVVGDEQHVRTSSIAIKKEYDNNNMPVIEVSEKDPDKWTIKALNPGKVDVVIHKSMSGFKNKKRHCKHTITVKPKKTKANNNKPKSEKPKKTKAN